MESYDPEKDKDNTGENTHQGRDLVASQIYQGIWDINEEACCTFDLDLIAAKTSRKRELVVKNQRLPKPS